MGRVGVTVAVTGPTGEIGISAVRELEQSPAVDPPHWGPVRAHRRGHADHLPPQTRPHRHHNAGSCPLHRHCDARRVGAPPHLPDPNHQRCCAHALHELPAVIDTADPDAGWRWATRVRDAVVAMQNLVNQAIAAGATAADPHALSQQVHWSCGAAQIGMTQTAARSDTLDAQAQRACPTPARPPKRLPARGRGSSGQQRRAKVLTARGTAVGRVTQSPVPHADRSPDRR